MNVFKAWRLSSINKAEKKAGNSDEKGHLTHVNLTSPVFSDGIRKTKGLLSRDGQGG